MRLRAPVSMPQRDVMVAGERVPLDPGQYDEYQRVSGAAAGQALRAAIQSPMWQTMTDDQRRDYVKEAFKDARREGRGALMASNPALGADQSSKGKPSLPPGYIAGLLAPKALKGLRGTQAALPPLPPGYALTR